ncbi:MAG: LLM class F420-dependent oxidoreductase [Chloroflexi bacterium SZAS-1]|nr:LLM class F420-dependent oxidoreductase [Chloroflexi bacterium SZAS-1]
MKLDAALAIDAAHLRDVAGIVRAAEDIGFGALWAPETQHNGFYPLVLAAEHSQRIELGTAVAIAFPRSPMVMAQNAWDLQALSRGRFILGLGTQVKAHIERRYSTPWEAPVARLRDYIAAMRAIWHSWQTGDRLNYQGQFYQHTLMTPFFNPGPIDHPQIPIYIAGVNEGLARLAGEVCDGFHIHPFHSTKYISDVVRPQIAAGAASAGRTLVDVTLVSSAFVVTGRNDAELDAMRTMAREQISFYASTPTYRVVLACHGWEDIGEQLSRLAAMKRWSQMSALVTDEMLDVFTVQAPIDTIGAALRTRYGGILDRVFSYVPFVPGTHDVLWRTLVAALQS